MMQAANEQLFDLTDKYLIESFKRQEEQELSDLSIADQDRVLKRIQEDLDSVRLGKLRQEYEAGALAFPISVKTADGRAETS